ACSFWIALLAQPALACGCSWAGRRLARFAGSAAFCPGLVALPQPDPFAAAFQILPRPSAFCPGRQHFGFVLRFERSGAAWRTLPLAQIVAQRKPPATTVQGPFILPWPSDMLNDAAADPRGRRGNGGGAW